MLPLPHPPRFPPPPPVDFAGISPLPHFPFLVFAIFFFRPWRPPIYPNSRQALWRSCAVMLDGFFINGPFLHYLYEFLEECMPAGKSIHAAVLQV